MDFNPGQVCSVTGASKETLRHWRKAVPYLAGKSGKAARFSFTEIVALAVVREALTRLGIGISDVCHGVDQLLHIFAQTSWSRLDGQWVVLGAETASIVDPSALARMQVDSPVVVIPCRPVLDRVRHELLSGAEPDAQSHLQFPPTKLASSAGAAGLRGRS